MGDLILVGAKKGKGGTTCNNASLASLLGSCRVRCLIRVLIIICDHDVDILLRNRSNHLRYADPPDA